MKKYCAELVGTFLVGIRRMWECCVGSGLFRMWALGCWESPLSFGSDGADDGLCDWAYFGLPFESSGIDWALFGRTFFLPRSWAPYIVAQVVGAILAGGVLYMIVSGQDGFEGVGGFASNGYGKVEGAFGSPGDYSLMAGFITEVVMTAIFLFIILGATDGRAPAGVCSYCYWSWSDFDSLGEYSCHEHFGEPCS